MGGYGAAMRAYATFQGRASRAEFWQFTLVVLAINIAAYVLFGPGPGRSVWPTLFFLMIALAHAVPYFAVLTRRMHDLDATGWWALLGLVPVVGLILLIPAAFRGTEGPNRFGGDPLATARRRASDAQPSHEKRGERRLPPFEQPETASRADVVTQLERLSQLRASGSLSEDEFEAMKSQVLARDGKA